MPVGKSDGAKLYAPIAVIDDNESFRTSMQQFLGVMGYEVVIFSSAVDFLHDLNSHSYGCAIVDIRMPVMNGLALQQQINVSGINLPIVFVTAHDNDDFKMQALESGASAYLLKPFSSQSLLDAITFAMGMNSGENGSL